MVNRHGKRFYDEGEDLWPKRYAIWGKLIAEQPDQIAYSIFDRKSLGKFLPTWSRAFSAETMSALSEKIGLSGTVLEETVKTYNQHVVDGEYDTSRLDDCRTEGLDPPKTHWAVKISQPPFFAYPLRPGITFTYLGVAVDRTARVIMTDGSPFPNLYASGELMAGNILSKGYLAGFGLTIGTTFGRIAGEEAARAG
jgi:tricarballylate dehydrogenase